MATVSRRPPGSQPLRPEPPRGGGRTTPLRAGRPGPAAAEEERGTPGIRGRAGPRDAGVSLAAAPNQRSLFSMVAARPSPARHFRFPLKARAARRRSVRASGEGNERGGPARGGGGGWVGTRGGRGGGGAKGALRRHVTGTRRSSVGHFRWSAAAPLKRGGGESGRRCAFIVFQRGRRGKSASARRARAGGEGGRPGTRRRSPCSHARALSCVPREVERTRGGGGGDHFAAGFGSRRRRWVSSRRRRQQRYVGGAVRRGRGGGGGHGGGRRLGGRAGGSHGGGGGGAGGSGGGKRERRRLRGRRHRGRQRRGRGGEDRRQ